MITLIEALNYRCLRYVRQELDRFHVLVGPNASGKSTFFDVPAFLGDFVRDGLEKAVTNRASDLGELIWQQAGLGFEMAIEVRIPKDRQERLDDRSLTHCRYEVCVARTSDLEQIRITGERIDLIPAPLRTDAGSMQEISAADVPESIVRNQSDPSVRAVIERKPNGISLFSRETETERKHKYKLSPRASALANLPEDESMFPVATWLKRFLVEGVTTLDLDGNALRRPASSPTKGRLRRDGSHLPWAVQSVRNADPSLYEDWIAHVREALPGVTNVQPLRGPEGDDAHLAIAYDNGLEIPSWAVSDGTLRLLALTLVAYLPDLEGRVLLIEEPENAIHPRAIETVCQSLASVDRAQVLLATHSPLVVGLVEPEQVLCFSRSSEGATRIVRGSDHPALRDWKRETDLGTLFAAGVLSE